MHPLLLVATISIWAGVAFADTAPELQSATSSSPTLATNIGGAGGTNISTPRSVPSAGNPAKDSPLWLQTLITVCVSILTTLFTTWLKDLGRKKQLLQEEFTDSVKELRTLSEDVYRQVELHLIAEPFSAARQRASHIDV